MNKYSIIDEQGLNVHEHSIKKIGKSNYTYVNYPKVERRYTKERAIEALECLNLHNKCGNLNHSFAIMESSQSKNFSEEKFYLTVDQNGYFAGQIYFAKTEGTKTELTYLAEKYPHHANGDIRRAVAEIQELNEYASSLGLEGYKWHLMEVNKEEWTKLANHSEEQTYARPTFEVAKGKIGITKKLIRDIDKKYDSIYRKLEIELRARETKIAI